MKIKVLSYNIHKGADWSGLRNSLAGVKKVIIESDADIVFLQEIIGERTSDKKNSQLEFLAGSIWDHYSYGKNAVYTKGNHGNAIFSKFPILKSNNYDLSINKFEQRGLLYAKVDLFPEQKERKVIDLFCTHLNLRSRDRMVQYEMIKNILISQHDRKTPAVIAGDFNDWNKKSPHFFKDELGFDESFLNYTGKLPKTFPSLLPILSLDRIFSRNLKVLNTYALNDSAYRKFSDHIALILEFDI